MNVSKYATGKIYGIRCNTTNLLYVGSTMETLKLRESKHLTDLRGFMGELKQPRKYRTSFECLMNKNYDYFLIEEYPCKTKEELEIRETLHIHNNICVNKHVRNITLEDYDLSTLPSVPSFT